MKQIENKEQPRSIQNGAKISELTPAKKKIYVLLTLLLPFVILASVEIGLRIFNYGTRPALFVSIPNERSEFNGINLDIAKRYFTRLSDVPTPRKDLFLKEKPNNCYRFFILGESTAAGFPFGNNITFPRILQRRLSDAFPDKLIEVINTGMTAISSYAQLDFMDEIVQQKPDAILIYSGHNEYYGALGVGSMESIGKNRRIVNLSLDLQQFRTYILLRNIIEEAGKFAGLIKTDENSDPSATLMERIVKNNSIPLGSDDYETGKSQFRENLRTIIEKAQHAGVRVLLSELVSNVKDNEPFESIEAGNTKSAMSVYTEARRYEREGKYDEAKKAYYKAKDLDPLRFRAPEDFNDIIRTVAAEYRVPVVPMVSYFESHSPHGLIGSNVMLEHLHPNLDGYFLMADAFFHTMRNERFIDSEWNEESIKPSSYYKNHWGYTPLDSVYAAFHIQRLKGGWPFVKQHGPNLALAHYKPATEVESVAVLVLDSDTFTLEQGHIELAAYYERQGDLEKAFNEYNALIYTVPYFDLFYRHAVKVCVEMKNYDRALEILFNSLNYQQTAFAYQWIGQIYLITNETEKGITFLEKARTSGAQDDVLLYNLGKAYFRAARLKEGDEVLNQLRARSSDVSLVSMLEAQRKSSYLAAASLR